MCATIKENDWISISQQEKIPLKELIQEHGFWLLFMAHINILIFKVFNLSANTIISLEQLKVKRLKKLSALQYKSTLVLGCLQCQVTGMCCQLQVLKTRMIQPGLSLLWKSKLEEIGCLYPRLLTKTLSCQVLLNQKCTCEGLSKISHNFTLHPIKARKLKRFKKVSSDSKTILKSDLANLQFLSFEEGKACHSNLIYVAWENRLN